MTKNHAKKACSPLLLLGSVAALGCSGGEYGALGEQRDSLYVLSTVLWDKGDTVPVCWDDTSGLASASDRNGVKRGALSWSSVANINFAGWDDDCPSSGFEGIKVVVTNNDSWSASALGKPVSGFHTLNAGMESNIALDADRCASNGVPREDCIRDLARHEWGHVLGFSHDNNHPDSECDRPPQGTNGDTLIDLDFDSVMSYCSQQLKLSHGDVHGSVLLYGLSPALQTVLL
jgi:hypothetical protein